MKLFWVYLLDNCNHAGIWEPNWPLAQFHLGVGENDVELSQIIDRVQILRSKKWFIPKFIEFQYGTLQCDNRAHQSVILALQKEGAYKPLISPFQGDKDKDSVKESLVFKNGRPDNHFDLFWQAYPKKVAKEAAKRIWRRLNPTPELFEAILRGVKGWSETENWTSGGGQFILHPTTFLNQRRWEDDIPRSPGYKKPEDPAVVAKKIEAADERIKRAAERDLGRWRSVATESPGPK